MENYDTKTLLILLTTPQGYSIINNKWQTTLTIYKIILQYLKDYQTIMNFVLYMLSQINSYLINFKEHIFLQDP